MALISPFRPILAGLALLTVLRADPVGGQYRLLDKVKVGGAGGYDYVQADSVGRRLYIPRSDRIMVYDLDSLREVGTVSPAPGVHGAVVDPVSHHGFSSSQPVVMWDARTLVPLRTIEVGGAPDGIFLDPATQRVFILSHRAPNATILDAQTGDILGTIDLGGAPEQAAADGAGRVYIDIEDKDAIAVVDSRTLQVVGRYDISAEGRVPAGLVLDPERHLLFALCRNPAVCVIVDAGNGKILRSLPIGAGTDGGAFNPATHEVFSSQRDGTLTVIREESPGTFAVAQNLATMAGAKTCTLDPKSGKLFLIAAETVPAPPAPTSVPGAAGPPARAPRPQMVPGSFSILVVGK